MRRLAAEGATRARARRTARGRRSRLLAAVVVRGGPWLVAAAVLAGLALRPAAGDGLAVTRATGYVMPWLLLALVPGALWAAREGRRALAAALGASAAAIVALHAPAFVPRAAPGAPGVARLGVMSFNTWSRNTDALAIARAIRGAAPDLVLLQEIPPAVFDRVVHALRDLYGGAAVHRAYAADVQQGVISRHPVVPVAVLPEKGRAQQVVVHAPGGPLVVFNVHPLRTGGWRRRLAQVRALLEEEVLRERSPVIVGGDLNANEHSELYRSLAARLRNAHDAAGLGLGFTYPAAVHAGATFPALPLARIDHLFYGPQLQALRAATLSDSGGSDHRPVFAELALAPARDGPLPAPRTALAPPGHPRRGPRARRAGATGGGGSAAPVAQRRGGGRRERWPVSRLRAEAVARSRGQLAPHEGA